MALDWLESLYVVFTATLITTGLTMAAMAVRAYAETERRSMIYLSIGFTLIVAAAATTAVSALLNDFQNPRMLLTVNSFFMTLGFLAVIFSLYES